MANTGKKLASCNDMNTKYHIIQRFNYINLPLTIF